MISEQLENQLVEGILNTVRSGQLAGLGKMSSAVYSLSEVNLFDKKKVISAISKILDSNFYAKFNSSLVASSMALVDAINSAELSLYKQALDSGIVSKLPSYSSNYFVNAVSKASFVSTDYLRYSMQGIGANVADILSVKKLDYFAGNISLKKLTRDTMLEAGVTGYRVPVSQKNGVVNYSVDSLITKTMRSEVNNVTLTNTLKNIENSGVELVEVSWHLGSRPEHADWEGAVYYLNEPIRGYDSFEVCGYGEADGLGGVNCRHRFGPFFEGINEVLEKKEYDEDLYEKTQDLRKLERSASEAEYNLSVAKTVGADKQSIAELESLYEQKLGLASDYAKESGLRLRI